RRRALDVEQSGQTVFYEPDARAAGGQRVTGGELLDHLPLRPARRRLADDAVGRERDLLPGQQVVEEPLVLRGQDVHEPAWSGEIPEPVGNAGIEPVASQPSVAILTAPRVPCRVEGIRERFPPETAIAHPRVADRRPARIVGELRVTRRVG